MPCRGLGHPLGPFPTRLEFEESRSSILIRMFSFLSWEHSRWEQLVDTGAQWGGGGFCLESEQPSQHSRSGGGAGAWLLAAAQGHRLYPACAQSWARGRDRCVTQSWGRGSAELLSRPHSDLGLRSEPGARVPDSLTASSSQGHSSTRCCLWGLRVVDGRADSRSCLHEGSQRVHTVSRAVSDSGGLLKCGWCRRGLGLVRITVTCSIMTCGVCSAECCLEPLCTGDSRKVQTEQSPSSRRVHAHKTVSAGTLHAGGGGCIRFCA